MSRAVKSRSFRALGLVLASAYLLSPSLAAAIDLGTTVIKAELVLPDDSGELERRNPNVEDVVDHFNFANCVCGEEAQFGVRVSLEDAPQTFPDDRSVEFWTGSGCNSDREETRLTNCLDSESGYPGADSLRTPRTIALDVKDLVSPLDPCSNTARGSNSVYLISDEDPQGIGEGDLGHNLVAIDYDMESPPAPTSISLSGGEQAIQIDWKLPTTSSEDIRYFQVLCERVDETFNEADGFPSHDPQYLTSRMACGSDADGVVPETVGVSALGPELDAGPTGADAGTPDAGTVPDAGLVAADLPVDLRELNPDFICGQAAGTDGGIRVGGLENDVPYRVVLLAIDNSRNVTALDLGVATPLPVEDGWEHYQKNGGQADGGYCFVATATFGNYDHPFVKILRVFRDDTLAHSSWGRGFIRWYYDNSPGLAAFIERHPVARAVSYVLLAPLVVFAAVWEYTGLLGKLTLLLAMGMLVHMRRRRRSLRKGGGNESRPLPTVGRRVVMATAGAIALLAFSATASAQTYWDEYNEPLESDNPASHWNFEMKFGPYSPSVDDSSGGMTPFSDVYGEKWKVMTIFGLDRYFAFPSGQLGITGTIGFSNRSAKAYALGPDGEPYESTTGEWKGELVRSKGDSTSFRLMPTSLGAVYRFTDLDEKYGIPVVPYGKFALAYYLWWFTDPSGDTSEIPTSACPDAGMPGSDCDGNLGRGGSFGYQATVGVAIRAERIDPGAELSLRTEMGIEHAGFFVEIQRADVDGFGASKKLSVGDTTWFGGINFEF